MVRVSTEKLEKARPNRPEGYVEAIREASSREEGGFLYVDSSAWAAIQERFGRPPPPSLPRMAMNAAGAIGRAAMAIVAHKRVLASQERRGARVAICRTNQCGYFNDNGRCMACGCACDGSILTKTMFETEKCPKGLW